MLADEYFLNFKTESFSFKTYTHLPIEDEMLEEFREDELTQKFLPDLFKYIEETEKESKIGSYLRYTTIIYFNDNPIGVLSLYSYDKSGFVISHGIRPKDRGQRFSSRFKSELYAYLFNLSSTIEQITAYVDKDNNNNLKVLKRMDEQEVKVLFDPKENKEYYAFITYNPNYVKGEDSFKI